MRYLGLTTDIRRLITRAAADGRARVSRQSVTEGRRSMEFSCAGDPPNLHPAATTRTCNPNTVPVSAQGPGAFPNLAVRSVWCDATVILPPGTGRRKRTADEFRTVDRLLAPKIDRELQENHNRTHNAVEHKKHANPSAPEEKRPYGPRSGLPRTCSSDFPSSCRMAIAVLRPG